MPIKINLLAEAQAAEQDRRQDPIKRAIAGAVVVVVLALGWCGWTIYQTGQKADELKQLNATWAEKKPRWDLIKTNDLVMLSAQRSIGQLHAYGTNRTLWGPVLQALTRVATNSYATNLQVTRLMSDQTFVEAKATKAVTNAAGKVVTPAKPGGMVERSKLSIIGKDSGSDLDENSNRMARSLMEDVYLKTVLEPGTGGARLTEVMRGAADPLQPGSTPVLNFVLQCSFEEKLR